MTTLLVIVGMLGGIFIGYGLKSRDYACTEEFYHGFKRDMLYLLSRDWVPHYKGEVSYHALLDDIVWYKKGSSSKFLHRKDAIERESILEDFERLDIPAKAQEFIMKINKKD